MGMIADFFQREGKKEVVQQRLKSERRKGKKSEGRCLRRGKEMKSRSEAVEEREEIAEESSEREKESKERRKNERCRQRNG